MRKEERRAGRRRESGAKRREGGSEEREGERPSEGGAKGSGREEERGSETGKGRAPNKYLKMKKFSKKSILPRWYTQIPISHPHGSTKKTKNSSGDCLRADRERGVSPRNK